MMTTMPERGGRFERQEYKQFLATKSKYDPVIEVYLEGELVDDGWIL